MDVKLDLINKIVERKARVGIVGLGYVGLPLALCFGEQGYQVIGFDIDEEKIALLNTGTSYIKNIRSERILPLFEKGYLSATNDFSQIADTDAIIICVPTPLNKHREPDLSYIINTVEMCIPYFHSGQLISLESTTYPGTTEEVLQYRIEKAGLRVGKDVFLVYSPEREDPGNKEFTTKTIPKVIGGISQHCLEVGVSLYESVIKKVVPVSSTKTAEMTKLLENIYRSVNIGLVNELKIAADKMGINIWEVIEAASTKPFGYTPFYPGPGMGGHCIPIDPFYLTWKAREYDVHTRFIELAGEINTLMPEWVVSKISDGLNRFRKSINGSKILVIGIAYKKNSDDLRESPSVKLMQILQNKGAVINYSDPYLPIFPKIRNYYFPLESVSLTRQVLLEMDCVLIATDHDIFDYDLIRDYSKMIVDTRGRYRYDYPNVLRG